MTVIEAINQADELNGNAYSLEMKVSWLSELDMKIKLLLIDSHENETPDLFFEYDSDVDLDAELLVPPPFDNMYPKWIEAKINFANGEYDRYNASISVFNAEYEMLEKYYHRNHMPKSTGNRFRF